MRRDRRARIRSNTRRPRIVDIRMAGDPMSLALPMLSLCGLAAICVYAQRAGQLFNPDDTITQECPACGATKQPGEDKAPACTVDRDHAIGVYGSRRPAACLNRYDQPNAQIPF